MLVSSEGAVMHIIQETQVSRCNRFFKVNDVEDAKTSI